MTRPRYVLTGAALAALLFSLAGLTSRPQAAETTLPPELDLVPRDAVGFVSYRVADLVQKPELRAVFDKLAKQYAGDLAQSKDKLGFDPLKLDRVVVLMRELRPGREAIVMILSNTEPFAQEKLRKAIQESENGRDKAAMAPALHFVNDKLAVVCTQQTMEEFLKDFQKQNKHGALADALKEAAGNHVMTVGVNAALLSMAAGDKVPDEAEAFRPLLKTKLALATIDLDKELRLHCRFNYDGAEEAKQAAKSVETGLAAARVFVAPALRKVEQDKTIRLSYSQCSRTCKQDSTMPQSRRRRLQSTLI